VPETGTINASGLKYCSGLLSITLPRKSGLTEGRTGLRLSPLFDGLNPSCGVNGRPDCRLTMALVVQPLTIFSFQVDKLFSQGLPCPSGNSYVPLITARWRTSVLAGP